ncbi:hypothetical protein GIB67_025266, partial [Kingdonia uniflora]
TNEKREREREKATKMEDESAEYSESAIKWLQDVTRAHASSGIEALTLGGLDIVKAQKGLIKCNFVVRENIADKTGNWHPGAMATLIDCVGAAAIMTSVGYIKVSVNFNVSYFSTAKIGEAVEIEAKILGHRNKLSSVIVEIRRKENGDVIAIGKQWMISKFIIEKTKPSKL